jgi:hypothetical protein
MPGPSKRRWILWIGGFVLLLAGAMGAVALLGNRSDLPFEFLEGRKIEPLPKELKAMLKGHGVKTKHYTFRADYKEVVERARVELLAEGYVEEVHPRIIHESVWFVHGDVRAVPLSQVMDVPAVAIRTGRVFDYPGGGMWIRDKAEDDKWVTVAISGKPAQGPFDRLRSWLGL